MTGATAAVVSVPVRPLPFRDCTVGFVLFQSGSSKTTDQSIGPGAVARLCLYC